FPPSLRLRLRNILPSVAKNARHPDQFIQEFVEAPNITLIDQISLLIEEFLHVSEIHVPKNCHQAELTHHRQQTLDRTRTAKQSRRNTTDPDSLVNVLLEIHIECVLQEAGITVIGLGRY